MFKSQIKRWQDQSPLEKGELIVAIPLAIAIVVSATLALLDKIPTSISDLIIFPSIFIITIINGLQSLKTDKRNAVIIFVCAAIILACGIFTLLL